jgi:hypothetical protein
MKAENKSCTLRSLVVLPIRRGRQGRTESVPFRLGRDGQNHHASWQCLSEVASDGALRLAQTSHLYGNEQTSISPRAYHEATRSIGRRQPEKPAWPQ